MCGGLPGGGAAILDGLKRENGEMFVSPVDVFKPGLLVYRFGSAPSAFQEAVQEAGSQYNGATRWALTGTREQIRACMARVFKKNYYEGFM